MFATRKDSKLHKTDKASSRITTTIDDLSLKTIYFYHLKLLRRWRVQQTFIFTENTKIWRKYDII